MKNGTFFQPLGKKDFKERESLKILASPSQPTEQDPMGSPNENSPAGPMITSSIRRKRYSSINKHNAKQLLLDAQSEISEICLSPRKMTVVNMNQSRGIRPRHISLGTKTVKFGSPPVVKQKKGDFALEPKMTFFVNDKGDGDEDDKSALDGRSMMTEEYEVRAGRLDNLIEKNKEFPKVEKCIICAEKVADCVFEPCGHGGMCFPCSDGMLKHKDTCPFCRVVRLFFIF
jgi:hypothetical protein